MLYKYRPGSISKSGIRWLCGIPRRSLEDEGDWSYSSEWWGSESDGRTVFRETSNEANGIVSVVAHPCSKPTRDWWLETEKWLNERYADMQPDHKQNGRFKILGYEWRSLRFNEDTRQSTVKTMATYRETEPGSMYFMQQPDCLAVPYLRSMVSVGLATLASCYDLVSAACGKKKLRILCIGHGGGSLPLFLASKIPGAVIDIVEIDPLVISASVQAMGFPAFSVMNPSGERALPKPNTIDSVLWRGIHERLHLYESDAEKFVVKYKNVYDIVFVDAYDGGDIFPHKLWDPQSPFLKAMSDRLHPDHGTIVVNLHSESDFTNPDGSISYFHHGMVPLGNYVSKVYRAYKSALIGNRKSGLGLAVPVPWLCNTSLVLCRGLGIKGNNKDIVMSSIISKAIEVEQILNLEFPCLEFVKGGAIILD